MDEKDFEILSVLSRTGNITRAAEQLYITQSALSKRIKLIEKELGTELFLRSRQGIRFTPSGEEALRCGDMVQKELSQLRESINAMQDKVCGTLNAGISINFALYCLPDILAEYHRLYPMVRLHISTGQSRDIYRQMSEGKLDIAVIRGEYPFDGMHYLLSQENICLVYNKEYRGVPLSEYPYIGRRTDSVQAGMVNQWLHDHDLDVRDKSFFMDSVSTCIEMVRRGMGWSLLPEIALRDYNGIIEPCSFKDGEPFIRRTHIICQREASRLPQIEGFIELLKAFKKE